MAKLTEIEATYRVVTPLFCAGADHRRAEIRLPSFKGVLRFWWRALAWSRLHGDLKKIQQEEDTLFGSADAGQSSVLMHLALASDSQMVSKDTVLTVSETNRQVVGDGVRYLGYGVMEAFDGRITKAGRLSRACLNAPFEFTVQMRGRDLTNQQMDSLNDSLIALGILGGMGSKNRKGYGSLAIRSLHVNGEELRSVPHSINDLCDAIKAFQSKNNGEAFPAFTALSGKARHILLLSNNKEPLELLNLVGRELVRYRSWGRNGKIFRGEESEKNFRDDHDLMKRRGQNRHPRRIAFGLPHNYGKKQVKPNIGDRRSSPLFIHIHECGGKPVAVLSFLPAQFLPKGKSDISVDNNIVPLTKETMLFQPIDEFLDRLLDRNKRKEPFTNVREVSL